MHNLGVILLLLLCVWTGVATIGLVRWRRFATSAIGTMDRQRDVMHEQSTLIRQMGADADESLAAMQSMTKDQKKWLDLIRDQRALIERLEKRCSI